MENLEIPIEIVQVTKEFVNNLKDSKMGKYYAWRRVPRFPEDQESNVLSRITTEEYLHPAPVGWTKLGVYHFDTKEDLLECLKRVNLPKKVEATGFMDYDGREIMLYNENDKTIFIKDIYNKMGLKIGDRVKITFERIK